MFTRGFQGRQFNCADQSAAILCGPQLNGGTRCCLSAAVLLMAALGGVADGFVCGSEDFVQSASALIQTGQRRDLIRTERFGPTRA